ncbi:MAG: hypothetical protein MZV70_05625 [Desulfobacterales bacterium]|nr:hypothetical protein [Desulfobacterales bacterium]
MLARRRRRRRGGRARPQARQCRMQAAPRRRPSRRWQAMPGPSRTGRAAWTRAPQACSVSASKGSDPRTPTAAAGVTENIYQKRHIAAGIPSIVRQTTASREFDALGSVVPGGAAWCEPAASRTWCPRASMFACMTRASLLPQGGRRPCGGFERALAVDGDGPARRWASNLGMLAASFAWPQRDLPPVPERVPVPRATASPRLSVHRRCSATSMVLRTRARTTTPGSARLRGLCADAVVRDWSSGTALVPGAGAAGAGPVRGRRGSGRVVRC